MSHLDALYLEVLADRLTLLEDAERRPEAKRRALSQALLARHPDLADRVAGEIVDAALERWPCCLLGLDHVAATLIEWRGGEPLARSDVSLRLARSLLDEDLLTAASAAAFRHRHGMSFSLPDAEVLLFDPMLPALDRDLEELLERPLSETHLHLGGAAPPSLFWLPLVLGLYSAEQAARMIAEAVLYERPDPRSPRELTDLALDRILEAAVLRWRLAARVSRKIEDHPFQEVRGLARTDDSHGPSLNWPERFRLVLDRLTFRTPPSSGSPPLAGCPIWIHPQGEIPYRDPLTQAVEIRIGLRVPSEAPALGERFLLACALRHLRSRGGEDDPELRAELLRYVRIKNAILRLLVHYPGIHGLDRFRQRYSRTARGQRRYDKGRRRDVWRDASIRYLVRTTILRWLAASTSQRLLDANQGADTEAGRAGDLLRSAARRLERRLEFRLAPTHGPAQGQVLLAVARGIQDALRTLRQASPADAPPEFQTGLVFHLHKITNWRQEDYAEVLGRTILWLDDHPTWRPLVIGIDAAGSELDAPPSRFAAAYSTVTNWRGQGATRDRSIPLDLGKTFHVGEDFRDLLTGLCQIHLAVRTLGLSAGDRLGHALALGLDPESWYQGRNGHSFPRLGDHLFNLLWAWNLLNRAGHDGAEARAAIRSRLHDAGLLELDGAAKEVESWIESLAALHQTSEQAHVDDEDQVRQALLSRLTQPHSLSELTEVVSDESWLGAIRCLQTLVRVEVDRKGIFVEANPTSNLLIAGLDDFKALPLFAMHPVSSTSEHPLRLSVSTDDPAVFRVNLREEYHALFEAALESGAFGRRAILDWLERLRADSFDSSFLRQSAPAGTDLLRYLQLIAPCAPTTVPLCRRRHPPTPHR